MDSIEKNVTNGTIKLDVQNSARDVVGPVAEEKNKACRVSGGGMVFHRVTEKRVC